MTAQETLDYYTKQCKGTIRTAMIEFAKFHVKNAIKAQIKIEYDRADKKQIKYLVEEALKNTYPLDNIK